ncbi:MAG: M15 family metallopeptidase [Roseiarcus sp.]
MADRAILPIDIDDSAFKAFVTKFAAYQKAVGDMPAQWSAVNKATGASRSTFEKQNELIEQQHDLINNLADSTERSEKPTQNVAASWGVIYRTGRLWSSSIKSSTLSLAKWTGLTAVFSGILASGGLYGIDRMAASVSGRRSSAMGYGTTIGAQSSFLTNFGRLGNAEGILGSTSRALSDPRSRVFRSLGVSGKIEGMDAPHAFAAILPDIERLLKRTPENQLSSIIQGYGLGEVGIGLNEARFIRNARPSEIESMRKGFASNEGAMGVANPEAWSRFSTQMELAGGAIRVAFERNLASMTLPLGRITTSFETLFTALLKKGGVADDLIKTVGDGIDKFAKMIGSKSVVSAVDDFISNFDITTKKFDAINDWLGQHGPELKIVLAATAGYVVAGPWGAAVGAAAAVGSMWDGPDTPVGRAKRSSGVSPAPAKGGSSPYKRDFADDRRSSTPYQGGWPGFRTPIKGGDSPAKPRGQVTPTTGAPSNFDEISRTFNAAAKHPEWGLRPGAVSTTTVREDGQSWQVAKGTEDDFQGFLDEMHEKHPDFRLVSAGGYNVRPKRGGGGWSMHAYGTAIDINAGANPFHGSRNTFPSDTEVIAARHGISWGKHFGDPMHFEYTGIKPNFGQHPAPRKPIDNHPNNTLKQSEIPVEVINRTCGGCKVSTYS